MEMYAALLLSSVIVILLGVVFHAILMRFVSVKFIYVAAFGLLNLMCLCSFLVLMVGVDLTFTPDAILLSILFLELFAICYVFILIGVANDSPTLAIVKLLMSKSEKGVSDADISEFIATHPFIESRIDGLELAGDVKKIGETLHLSAKAKIFVLIIRAYKRLTGHSRDFG